MAYLVLLSNKADVLMNTELLMEHVAHLRAMKSDGILKLAAPFTDDSGAFLIMEGESVDHIEQLIQKDPFIVQKYYQKYSIHEFIEATEDNDWLSS